MRRVAGFCVIVAGLACLPALAAGQDTSGVAPGAVLEAVLPDTPGIAPAAVLETVQSDTSGVAPGSVLEAVLPDTPAIVSEAMKPDTSGIAPGAAGADRPAVQPSSQASGALADSGRAGGGVRREAGKKLTDTANRLGTKFSPGNILAAVLVLILAYFAIRTVTFALTLIAERSNQYRLRLMKLVPVVRIFTWIIAIYVIIVDIFSPETDALLAFTASAGIAIGFASQDILKNIFGGILIIMDRPFQVGDKIQVGSYYGEVVHIGLRTVRLVTPDDSLVSVPNSEIVNQSVSNSNSGALDCQVVVEFHLPLDVDLVLAKRILFEAAATSRYIYLHKPIAVVVQDVFQEWFLTKIKVKAYVLDARYEFAFASEITETAKPAFLEAGVYNLEGRLEVDQARSRLLEDGKRVQAVDSAGEREA